MGKTPAYFIVEAGALPEVFLKVAEAKRLLETGAWTHPSWARSAFT